MASEDPPPARSSALDRLGDVLSLGTPGSRLRPDAWVLRRYWLEREVGHGRMGAVWRAFDRERDAFVALKVLSERTSLDPTALARICAEAHVLAALAHENVVRFHALHEQDGLTVLVMEYLEGPTLAELVRTRRARGERGLSCAEARFALRELAAALDHAHAKGVLHRDVKPANAIASRPVAGVLGAGGERVKLADFGIAFAASGAPDGPRGGGPAGTPAYMAPEVLCGDQPTRAADVWGLAATVYALVAGEPPFVGPDAIVRAVTERAPRLGSGDDALDRALAAGLATAPPDRPRHAGLLLELALADPRPQRGARRWVLESRAQRLALLAAAGLAALALLVARDERGARPAHPRVGRAPEGFDVLDDTPGAEGFARSVRDPRTGLVLVLVEPGVCAMGSSAGEGDDDERPRRAVVLTRPFYLARTEVTRAQWSRFLGAPPEPAPRGDLPVAEVSWLEARAFCERLGYRLPSEAEWEHAARAGGDARFAWGERAADGRGRANVADAGAPGGFPFDDGFPGLAPVASFEPSDLGLYDVVGNVAELVADAYASDAYARGDGIDPFVGEGELRVARGGSFRDGPDGLRVARRQALDPSARSDAVGLRPALDPETPLQLPR